MRKTRYGKSIVVSVIRNPNQPFRSFETLNPSPIDGCTLCSTERMESRNALWGNILQQAEVREDRYPGGALVRTVEELLDMPLCTHMYALDGDWKSILREYGGQGVEQGEGLYEGALLRNGAV